MSGAGRAGARVALLVAGVLGAALVVVLVTVPPWTLLPEPPGGRTPVDPASVLPPDLLARTEAFAGALRPASLTSLLLGLAVSAVLGLTQYAYAAAGTSLPHSSRMQATMGSAVSRSELQPGDLIFYYSPVSHVAMYIGNGQMVHASTSGQPVKVVSVDSMGGISAMRRVA